MQFFVEWTILQHSLQQLCLGDGNACAGHMQLEHVTGSIDRQHRCGVKHGRWKLSHPPCFRMASQNKHPMRQWHGQAIELPM
jgi:hypothetical protein